MLITRTKVGEFKPITIKDVPTYIATRHYFRCQGARRRQIKLIVTKKTFSIMAATKFTAIYVNNEGKIIEREIPGMNTYKIAEKFAKMLNDPEETKLVCVVELWKLYPKEDEKTEKD